MKESALGTALRLIVLLPIHTNILTTYKEHILGDGYFFQVCVHSSLLLFLSRLNVTDELSVFWFFQTFSRSYFLKYRTNLSVPRDTYFAHIVGNFWFEKIILFGWIGYRTTEYIASCSPTSGYTQKPYLVDIFFPSLVKACNSIFPSLVKACNSTIYIQHCDPSHPLMQTQEQENRYSQCFYIYCIWWVAGGTLYVICLLMSSLFHFWEEKKARFWFKTRQSNTV